MPSANPQQAKRNPEEEGDYMAFEQLMAEAAAKKGKDKEKDGDKRTKKGKRDDATGATPSTTPVTPTPPTASNSSSAASNHAPEKSKDGL